MCIFACEQVRFASLSSQCTSITLIRILPLQIVHNSSEIRIFATTFAVCESKFDSHFIWQTSM